jgi:hypothetical protein
MQQLLIRLYQTDDVLKERVPEGADALAVFVRVLSATLNQPEFEHPPQEDRAVVIAISPTGKSIGWAISRLGDVLNSEQQYLERVLGELEPPTVNGGAVVLAIHYSQAVSGEDWVPLPKAWNDIVQAADGPLPVDELVMHYFEETSAD